MQARGATDLHALGIHHVGMSVDSLEQTLDEMGAHGFTSSEISAADALATSEGNGLQGLEMRLAFASRGPVVIEVIEHARRGPRARLEPTDSGLMAWGLGGFADAPALTSVLRVGSAPVVAAASGYGYDIRLLSARPDRTLELFEKLGLQRVDDRTVVIGGSHARVAVDHATGTIEPPMPNDVGRGHIAFVVDDLDVAFAELSGAGFACVSRPIRHDANIRWMFVRDPGGSGEIELLEVRG